MAAAAAAVWLEAREIWVEEYGQGKDLSSQLIQHSKLPTKRMAGLCWVSDEPFQQRYNYCIIFLTCNVNGRALKIQVMSFLVEVPQVPATCQEPFNHLVAPTPRSPL